MGRKGKTERREFEERIARRTKRKLSTRGKEIGTNLLKGTRDANREGEQGKGRLQLLGRRVWWRPGGMLIKKTYISDTQVMRAR